MSLFLDIIDNRHSNHRPNIVWQMPLSVSARISNISSNQSIFNGSIPMHKETLTISGFNDDIFYNPVLESNNSERKNPTKRKVIWFDPPYSMNVQTNIGKRFFKLVKSIFHAIIAFIRYSTRTQLKSVIVA